VTPDQTGWSGDGDFTRRLLDVLQQVPVVVYVRVEDAPASQSAADYQFLSNEIYVRFETVARWCVAPRLGFVPWPRRVAEPVMTLRGLESCLTDHPDIGPPDYSDDEMLQYLRSERIVAPYQTRGFKLIEMVRVYGLSRPR